MHVAFSSFFSRFMTTESYSLVCVMIQKAFRLVYGSVHFKPDLSFPVQTWCDLFTSRCNCGFAPYYCNASEAA